MRWYRKASTYVGYHGSPNDFQEFSYKFMGEHGTSEGYGFYFTSDRDIAEGYAEGRGARKARLTINKPLSHEDMTISPAALAKFLRELDPDGQGYLSNWGESDIEGYDNVVRTAVKGEMGGSDNDVDLISGIINGAGRNPGAIYPILTRTLGYDGIVVHSPGWGGEQTVYVVFDNGQIRYL